MAPWLFLIIKEEITFVNMHIYRWMVEIAADTMKIETMRLKSYPSRINYITKCWNFSKHIPQKTDSGKNNLANFAIVFCETQEQETWEQQRSLILLKDEEVTAWLFYSRLSNRNAKKPLPCFSYKHKTHTRARSSVRLEHRTFNPGVAGSIPVGPATEFALGNQYTGADCMFLQRHF